MNRQSVSEKIGLNKYELDDDCSHIVMDEALCARCMTRYCLTICPASVYSENADKKVTADWAACLECGSCKVICPELSWEYPRGSFGIHYRSA